MPPTRGTTRAGSQGNGAEDNRRWTLITMRYGTTKAYINCDVPDRERHIVKDENGREREERKRQIGCNGIQLCLLTRHERTLFMQFW